MSLDLVFIIFLLSRLKDLRKKDKEKIELEKAKNDLESFIVDTQERLYRDEYEQCSSEEERANTPYPY